MENLPLRDILVLLLGREGRRILDLRTLSNAELFERWRGELDFRYKTERPRKEACRVIGLFEGYLGGYPPSADLTKKYLNF